ncbi:hypothetical protein MHPYR_580006 [uncultured Mycobacterium sp.]|uniref:Uncharacterized protein n=1 Tax=uncultured Mycobacterium sp. TaxID=171292 RepID=A0A1Y5PID4_9MYCO|nr:hypothetical protein MHPYR_580006 [uncultured Mycobacterium sp.]
MGETQTSTARNLTSPRIFAKDNSKYCLYESLNSEFDSPDAINFQLRVSQQQTVVLID